jgi:nucleotide-binding universal stress UspA family protein
MTATTQASDPITRRRSLKSLFSPDSLRLRRIVVPTALTRAAAKEIDSAVRLARKFGADLFLVHVYKEPYPLSYVRGPTAYGQYEQHRFNKEVDLFALRDQLRQQYPRCFAIFRQGTDITREISAVAKEIKADLIVLPAHHRSWFEHLCEGNAAERVVRQAPCPVLVLREEQELEAA